MSERVDIAMGFDDRYAPHAAAVISSIVRHAPGAAFRFIILHDGVQPARQRKIETVAPGAEFLWTRVSDDDLPEWRHGHINRATLFRFGLEKLGPADCHRVLYIDADVVVLDDVRKLAAVDLRDHIIGAVRDRYIDAAAFAGRFSLPAEAPRYFNAGVLAIDLDGVREQGLFSQAVEFVARHDAESLPWGDQDALNYFFWDRWCELDPIWNVQRFWTRAEMAVGPERPSLVHFVGYEKPWMPGAWHPWSWIYWDSIKRTPFAAEVAQTYKMNFYQLMRLRLKWWLRRPHSVALR
jgi:lipopolysaccharide biosynthesis glycosyltransferase